MSFANQTTHYFHTSLFLGILVNQLGRNFSNTVRRHLCVATVCHGHDTTVHNSQTLDTIDPQPLVYNRHRIVTFTNCAGADRMVRGRCVFFHKRLPVLVGLVRVVVTARRPGALDLVFGAGARGDELVGEPDALGHHEQVAPVGEVSVVHGGVLARVRALERHLSAGLHAHEQADHGECVLALFGEVGVPTHSYQYLEKCELNSDSDYRTHSGGPA